MMKRAGPIIAGAAAAGAVAAGAAQHTNVFNAVCPACMAEKRWTSTVDYARLERELFTLGNGRPVRTAGDWTVRRQEIRQRILGILGPFPNAVPLAPQVIEEHNADGMIRRRVSYQVEDGERVSAWLLIPDACDLSKRHPAILCIHQTTDVGKDEPVGLAGDPNLDYARVLCRQHGYITLTPDLLTAGERVKAGMKPFFTDDFYARHPGWSMFGKNLWDNMKAVDYLQGLAFVDPGRIGCTGHSLGGNGTLYLAAFDERIQAAVESCGGTQLFQANYDFALEYSRTHWYIYASRLRPYFLKKTVPYDTHELLALVAPRAYLQTGAFNDGVNPNPFDTVQTAALTKKVFAFRGAGGNYDLFMHHGTHGYPAVAIEHGVAVFDRVLRETRE